MLVFRITSTKYIRDLTGQGAYLHGGRWNSIGVHVLYTAQSPSLAAMEILVNSCKEDIPPELALVKIEIPEFISFEKWEVEELPSDWSASSPPESLIKLGDDWISRRASLVLQVPSAVIKVENNFLVNPNHPEFSLIKIVGIVPFEFDPRLFK